VGVMLFLVLIMTAAALFFCSGQRSDVPRAHWSAQLLTLAPAVVVSVVLLQAEAVRQPGMSAEETPGSPGWRVTLAGLQFRLSPGQAVRFGGNPGTDHIHVRGMPAGLLTLARDPAGELVLEQAASAGGVVVIREADARGDEAASALNDSLWGGIPIPAGVKFCRSDRKGSCGTRGLSWVAKPTAAQLVNAAGEVLCALPLGSAVTQRSGELRIYPLADHARPTCSGAEPFVWDGAQPATEFLYWRTVGGESQLFLYPAAGARYAVGKPQGGFEIRQATEQRLGNGAARDVYFHRYVRQELTDAAGSPKVTRIRDIRSFRVRHVPATGARESNVEIFLHTHEATRVNLGPEATLTISSRASNPATLAEGAAVAGFDVIGAPAATELLNLVKLQSSSSEAESATGQSSACFEGAAALTIRGISRLDCAPVGRWFSLGDPQFVQAKVRVAALQVPGSWLAAIWTLALVNLLVRAALSLPAKLRVVLVFLEVLLALRLLLAFDASLVDARHESTVAAAWLALLCLPAAFELALPLTARVYPVGLARLGKLLVIAAGSWLIGIALGVGGTAASWRAALQQDAGNVILVFVALSVALAVLVRFLIPAVSSLRERFAAAWSTPKAAAAPLVALAGVHVMLALAGVREQIGGLRVSTLLVPLLALAWAAWHVGMARPAATLREVLTGLMIGFLPLVGFLIARDNGAYVYFLALAVFVLPLAWPWIAENRLATVLAAVLLGALLLASLALLDSTFSTLAVMAGVAGVPAAIALFLQYRSQRLIPTARALWAVPAGVALAGVVALHVSNAMLSAQNSAAPTAAVGVQALDRIVDIEGNTIRLLDLIAPRTVEELGLRQGYEQRAAMSEMFAYAATLPGRGWPGSAIPRELRGTHVDDAVAAVHLVAPFGRIAALGVVVFLVAFAAAVATLLGARRDLSATAARLAVLLLVVVSLYMLFANIGVVPFTGRNFYLLSVASNSDLLEAGLLLSLIAAALAAPLRSAPP
jgi:hypothetical protein